MKYKLNILAISFLFLCSWELTGQLNIKVGYKGGFSTPTAVNEIIGQYNTRNATFLEQSFSELQFMSGLNLGIRYRYANSAVEVSWSNLTSDLKAIGNPSGNAIEKRLFPGLRNYSLGLQSFFGNIGLGASIDSRRLKMDTNIENFSDKRTFLEDTQWASTFSLLYQFPSRQVAFTIQPYVQIPWNPFNISGLERELLPDTTPRNVIDEDFMIFGISIAFYNGPQY